MTEPTCRHCGLTRDRHDAEEWCDLRRRRFTPGPTYATLQSQVRRLRKALRALVDATDWAAVGDLHEDAASRVLERAEIARAALTETEETDG